MSIHRRPYIMTYKRLVRLFIATIVQIVYGRQIIDMHDEYITTAQKAVESFSITRFAGTFWVEHFPFQRYLPSWAPGGKFKRVAKYYRHFVEKMRDMPFEFTKTEIVTYLLTLVYHNLVFADSPDTGEWERC